jgi:hypothetical protein
MTFEGENSTETIPVPAGEWHFDIAKIDVTAWQSRDDPAKGGLKFTAMLRITDPEVQQLTQRENNLVRFEGFLDMTPDGGLDMGKGMNVAIGRLREAVGFNAPGVPWTFDMLVGRSGGKVRVKHRPHPDRPGQMLADAADVVA